MRLNLSSRRVRIILIVAGAILLGGSVFAYTLIAQEYVGQLAVSCATAPGGGNLITWTVDSRANSNSIQRGNYGIHNLPNCANYWCWLPWLGYMHITPTVTNPAWYIDYQILPGIEYTYRIKYRDWLPSNLVTCQIPVATPTITPPVNNPPSVSNVRVIEPDYCSSGPVAFISWSYSDLDLDPQSAYQVQVSSSPVFAGTEVDTYWIASATTSYVTPVIGFNTTHYARVRAWDEHGAVSVWQSMTLCSGPGCAPSQQSWATPQHAYPGSVNFTWLPVSPNVNLQVAFSKDTTTCYAMGNIPTPCASFTWNFGDGTPVVVSPDTTQMHAYTEAGTYQVGFSARDAQGYMCPPTSPLTKSISIYNRLPKWKEVLPQ